jgi:hypothetical protein
MADGYVVEDPDWKAKKGHYRVRVPKALELNFVVALATHEPASITSCI